MPIRDLPLTKILLRSAAHMLCMNSADAFFEEPTKMMELVQTLIHNGCKGIILKT